MKPTGRKVCEKSTKLLDFSGSILAWSLLVVFFVLFPLYFKNGYESMASNKYIFYINTAKIAGSVFLAFFAVRFILFSSYKIKINALKQAFGSIICLCLYLMTLSISFALSGYKFVGTRNAFGFTQGAFYGAGSWYMGFVTLALTIMLALCLAFTVKYSEYVWIPVLSGVFIVSLWGILNRYGIYPINMTLSSDTFISSIGNIDWFAGYLTVAGPVALGLFTYSSNRISKIILAVISFICIYAGLICGADSAIAALFMTLLVLFALSFNSEESLDSFSNVLFIYFGAAIFIQLLSGVKQEYGNLTSEIGKKCIGITFLSLVAAVSLAIKIYTWMIYEKKTSYSPFLKKYAGKIIAGLFALFVAGLVLLVIVNTVTGGKISASSLFYFDSNWGSFRGACWYIAMELFKDGSIKDKLFGAGPDCFYFSLSNNKALSDFAYEYFWKLKLTNAHNEILTLLVNEGIVGTVAFVGLCINVLKTALKNLSKKPCMLCFILCMVSYLTNNFFSFRQIMNTPLFFMILGLFISALIRGGNIDKTGSKEYNS